MSVRRDLNSPAELSWMVYSFGALSCCLVFSLKGFYLTLKLRTTLSQLYVFSLFTDIHIIVCY